jgi:hypothetical protein
LLYETLRLYEALYEHHKTVDGVVVDLRGLQDARKRLLADIDQHRNETRAKNETLARRIEELKKARDIGWVWLSREIAFALGAAARAAVTAIAEVIASRVSRWRHGRRRKEKEKYE